MRVYNFDFLTKRRFGPSEPRTLCFNILIFNFLKAWCHTLAMDCLRRCFATVAAIFFASLKTSLEGDRSKNYWKPVRLRRSVFFISKPSIKRAYFGFGHKKTSVKRWFLVVFGGERGIRTPGTSRYAGFQDQCIRPLCHLSDREFENSLSGRQI